MSSFSDLDLNLINTHKRPIPESDNPIILKPNDFFCNKNQLQNNKRIKLPPLLSYKLPLKLLNKLELKQLSSKELDVNLSINLNQNLTPNSTPNLTPNSNSTVSTPISSTKKSINITNLDVQIKLITEMAEKLKKLAIKSFQNKDYLNSILNFTQSLILFILSLRIKEDNLNKNDNLINLKLLRRKLTDWLNIFKFSSKVIDNFNKILIKDNYKNNKFLIHILGFIYYLNGFIQIHRSNLILKLIEENNNNNELSELISLFKNFNEILTNSRNLLLLGEKNLGLFGIVREYPNLWSQSFTKLSSIKLNQIYLSFNLNIEKINLNLPIGVNYCLPICSHTWDLNSIINFGGFFLKEWCLKQSLNQFLVFK